MTSRDDDACENCARLQKTIDRLALELAEADARARTWRRVAQWIHNALSPETLPPEE